MSDRFKIITDRGNLSTEELCRIAISLGCHRLDRMWTEYLQLAYNMRHPDKMQKALKHSSKTMALTYHYLLTPVEWDFWLALRSWNPEPLTEEGELAHSAPETVRGR